LIFFKSLDEFRKVKNGGTFWCQALLEITLRYYLLKQTAEKSKERVLFKILGLNSDNSSIVDAADGLVALCCLIIRDGEFV